MKTTIISISSSYFTGSLGGGRALFDLACSRAEPIPFFGELGSVSPLFVMPAAAKARGAQLGKEWAGSLTMGVGQFCTNPGVVVIPAESAKAFEAAAAAALADVPEASMLTTGIASAYRNGVKTLRSHPEVGIGSRRALCSPCGSGGGCGRFHCQCGPCP